MTSVHVMERQTSHPSGINVEVAGMDEYGLFALRRGQLSPEVRCHSFVIKRVVLLNLEGVGMCT